MTVTDRRTCQVLVYRVADLPPERAYPAANLTRWRWELWDGDVFLSASAVPVRQTDPVLTTEDAAHRSARVAAEALGYRA